ncbi:hypothetical protein CMI38_04000, partial [Candidatus Pacearchaeota archaeon]|nr:hypothetical protein [Candidatus Pacearchaeota archaeon]
MNKELIMQEIINYLSERDFYLNKGEFRYCTDKYGKELFRKAVAYYVAEKRPLFPFREVSYEKMIDSFRKLQRADYTKFITPTDQIDNEVIEKYDDYKYEFKSCGQGLIDGPTAFNEVSDHFMNHLRLRCGSYGFMAPAQVWEEGTAKQIWSSIGGLWRGVNSSADLSPKSVMEVLRLGTYIATQFKPIVAKVIYEMTDAKTVLDTSMGWGDRLAGFFASNATHYIGCDPNPNTFEVYSEMIKEYSRMAPGKTTQIYRCGAEDLPWDRIKNVDCAFTSPPYYATERYNEGGQFEKDQSWSKFDEYTRWRDEFYLPVALNSFNSLSENGFLMVNIMDPKIKGVRYYSCDELVDHLQPHFLGQIGMRIMQRPQGKNKFETKEELIDFMNKTYIENVWCFGKNKVFDLFPHKRRATLEGLF